MMRSMTATIISTTPTPPAAPAIIAIDFDELLLDDAQYDVGVLHF